MNVIVLGATGRTGRHIVRHALLHGHNVTAFTRSAASIGDADVQVAEGDVMDAASVARAVAGRDAAIVALGANSLRDKTTLASGTRNVVNAMAEHGGGRLVVLSSAGAGDSWGQVSLLAKIMFKTMLRNVYDGHTAQEAIVRHSTLDWTIVRAAVLNDKPGSVRAGNEVKATYISRADLAQFLVEQLDDRAYLNQAVTVTS